MSKLELNDKEKDLLSALMKNNNFLSYIDGSSNKEKRDHWDNLLSLRDKGLLTLSISSNPYYVFEIDTVVPIEALKLVKLYNSKSIKKPIVPPVKGIEYFTLAFNQAIAYGWLKIIEPKKKGEEQKFKVTKEGKALLKMEKELQSMFHQESTEQN